MHAILLAGHGSLRRGAGAAMIRLAARLREREAAHLVTVGFLNYSRPSLADAVGRLSQAGATRITLLPFLLIPGYFTRVALPRAIAELHRTYPALTISQASPLGAHPALAAVVSRRAAAAGAGAQSALLLAAHGSPDPEANAPIDAVAAMISSQQRFGTVAVGYLGLNEPAIPTAIAAQVAAGYRHIVVVPYMLQLGDHTAEDIPAIVAAARARHPETPIVLAAPPGYDPLLVDALIDRAALS